jgi:hypothetical protein
MKRFQLRLSSVLWLVAVAVAFLVGIRYGEYRAEARRPTIVGVLPQDTSVTIMPACGP